ncbi:MAG: chitobiase/beta-hexosaminidase C-terminal domain-containing protein, partial [Saprospiraceae bacterium]|nr:chitobiase/beta-hexosaminidase C-terminal domain-containing protein [Saprospiraceae bacterium]
MTKLYHTFLLFLSAAVFVLPELKAQVVINEYSCANLSQFEDSYMEHEDWIELYNTSSSDSAHIQGWYLSDDDDEPTKFLIPNHNSLVIPPNGFLRIWCSGRNGFFAGALHTSFKLTQTKNKAEHLILADPTGTALQDVKVEKTQISQSRCRVTDGAAEWRICSTPTPKASNNGSTQFTGFADRPDFDQEAGFYQNQVTVTITTTEAGGQIYYTTDGSEPTPNSALYSGPIDITQTTVLKARTYSPNNEIFPSYVQFGTYFINVDHSLVVISVGSNGVLELANGNQSLRPEGSVEYFGKDKLRKARTYGSLNSHGQDSWVNDQRSIDWVSHDEMGYNSVLTEKIFQNSTRDEFQRL